VDASTEDTERVDIWHPGGEDIVALANPARILEHEFEADRRPGGRNRIEQGLLGAIARLGRAVEAAMELAADPVARTRPRQQRLDLGLRPGG